LIRKALSSRSLAAAAAASPSYRFCLKRLASYDRFFGARTHGRGARAGLCLLPQPAAPRASPAAAGLAPQRYLSGRPQINRRQSWRNAVQFAPAVESARARETKGRTTSSALLLVRAIS